MTPPMNDNGPMIMPTKKGTLSAADKAKLSKAGVIVIECDHPESLRLISLSQPEVSGTGMLYAAMTGLKKANSSTGYDWFCHEIYKQICANWNAKNPVASAEGGSNE